MQYSQKIGIIGGSGLENPNLFGRVEEIKIKTPYGEPSFILKYGKINGIDALL